MPPTPEKNAEGNLETSHAGGYNSGSAANSEIASTGQGVSSTPHVSSRQPYEPSALFEQRHTITQSTSSDASLYSQDWRMNTVSSGEYQQTPVRPANICVDSLNLTLDEATGWSVGNTSTLNAGVPHIDAPM